ncbi:MAG: ribosome biogenesis GTP-binding protein YihA/YsxC [Deltaproteobacteria bacterium]|nr:ribosome biogenesis GTP-binding protein YihA/YsxC [Deltaproteobacteria bacterium]
MKITSAEFICGAENKKDYPPTRVPEIAFAGRSNVGKSSMINSLLGRKSLVRTSKTPGLTRKINFFSINNSFIFVDLPGYGYASVPMEIRRSWAPMVNTYLTERKELAGVVVITDSRREPTEQDESLIEFLQFQGIPFVVALSKADKIGHSDRAALKGTLLQKWGDSTPVEFFSAVTGLGRKELWRRIIGLMANRRALTDNNRTIVTNSEE